MALNDWADGQAGGTPLSAARLNERDTAIGSAQSAATAAADTAKWANVSGKPSTFPAAAPAWGEVTGKPSTFSPTIGTTATTAAAGNHTHADLAKASDLAALVARVEALEQGAGGE